MCSWLVVCNFLWFAIRDGAERGSERFTFSDLPIIAYSLQFLVCFGRNSLALAFAGLGLRVL
jgi:hypothetical protein